MLSFLVHALLLSITLGGQKFGLPSLHFPWKEQAQGANELRVLLAPKPAPAPVEMDQPAVASDITPMNLPPPAVRQSEMAAVASPPPTSAPPAEPAIAAVKRPEVDLPIAPDAPKVRTPEAAVARDTPAQANEVPAPSDAAQKQAEQETRDRALEQVKLAQEKQNAERQRLEQQRQDAARAEQSAKADAARIEAERQELARQEVQNREAQRQAQAKQAEKAQQEAARQEAERAEAARQEQTKLAQAEAARQAQNQLAAARQNAIKQEAARRDALAQEAARQEAARQAAAGQERAKQDLAQRERAEQEAQREERLRAIGKQLNAEAAQRDPSRSLLPGFSSLRRGWLYGRADANAELVRYAEVMGQKIEMNMTFDMVRAVVKQPHTPPMVTVAIRADGSVEKVTFVVSSGVLAIDEAIRKVVASQAPYAVFPPGLARQYDVVEIRRTWIFDTAIRLQ
ncbi:MAG: TonB C-terminal domain-containing protein [Pseudomonadota bacterium]